MYMEGTAVFRKREKWSLEMRHADSSTKRLNILAQFSAYKRVHVFSIMMEREVPDH